MDQTEITPAAVRDRAIGPQVAIHGESAAQTELRRIEEELRLRYEPLLSRAGPLRGMLLRARMRRELNERLEKLAPRLPFFLRK